MDMKKNCRNCRHLEWVDGDYCDDSGFTCNGRDYSDHRKERIHLAQLEKDSYLNKSKVCFESKQLTIIGCEHV